jgi:hypothetical protein
MPIGLRRTNAGSAANLSTSTRHLSPCLPRPDAAVRGTREGTRRQHASVRGHRPRSASIATVPDARVRRQRAPLLVVGVQIRRPEPGSRRGHRAARCAARSTGSRVVWGVSDPTRGGVPLAPPPIQGVAHARAACLVRPAGSGPRTCRSPTVGLTHLARSIRSCTLNTQLAIVVVGPLLKGHIHAEPAHAGGRGLLARVTLTADVTVLAEHLTGRPGNSVRWCAPCCWRRCSTGPSNAERGSTPPTGSRCPAGVGHPHKVRRRPSRLTIVRRRSVPSSLGASADPVGAIGLDGHQRGASLRTCVMADTTAQPTWRQKRDPPVATSIEWAPAGGRHDAEQRTPAGRHAPERGKKR